LSPPTQYVLIYLSDVNHRYFSEVSYLIIDDILVSNMFCIYIGYLDEEEKNATPNDILSCSNWIKGTWKEFT